MLLYHAAGLARCKGLKSQGSSSPEVLKVFLGSTGFHRGASGEVWGWRSTEGPRGRVLQSTSLASMRANSGNHDGLNRVQQIKEWASELFGGQGA